MIDRLGLAVPLSHLNWQMPPQLSMWKRKRLPSCATFPLCKKSSQKRVIAVGVWERSATLLLSKWHQVMGAVLCCQYLSYKLCHLISQRLVFNMYFLWLSLCHFWWSNFRVKWKDRRCDRSRNCVTIKGEEKHKVQPWAFQRSLPPRQVPHSNSQQQKMEVGWWNWLSSSFSTFHKLLHCGTTGNTRWKHSTDQE